MTFNFPQAFKETACVNIVRIGNHEYGAVQIIPIHHKNSVIFSHKNNEISILPIYNFTNDT